jgi:hypothetical protein
MRKAGPDSHRAGRHGLPFLHCVLSRKPVSGTLPRPLAFGWGSADRRRRVVRTPRLFREVSMDYEIQRCSRHCAATGRELAPGEDFYSVLVAEGAELKRYDYGADAWQGPPEKAIGWWKSQMPSPTSKRLHWAPNDVMLHFFEQLEAQPQMHDMRYVLALLLVRRRVVRLEERQYDQYGREVLVLYCPRREATYRVPVVPPDEARTDQIQEELAKLLFARAG